MVEESMKKLKRPELLRMLLDAVRENERLEVELASTQSLLESRDTAMAEAGSLAEAAMRLNGVFESAQAAADHYLVNVQKQYEGREEMVEQMRTQAAEEAEAVVSAAQDQAQQLQSEAEAQIQQLQAQAQQEAQDVRDAAQKALEEAQAEAEQLRKQAEELAETMDAEAKARIAQMEDEAQGRTAQLEKESQERIAQAEEESKARIAQAEDEANAAAVSVKEEADAAAAAVKAEADSYAQALRAEADELKAQAQQVLADAQSEAEQLKAQAKEKVEALEAEARERIDARMSEAERVCQNLEQATKAKCDSAMRRAMEEARQYNETMRMAMQTLGIEASALPGFEGDPAAAQQAGDAAPEPDAETDLGADASPFDAGLDGESSGSQQESEPTPSELRGTDRPSTIAGIEEAVNSARAAVAAALSAAKTTPGTLDEDSAAIFYPNATAEAAMQALGSDEGPESKEESEQEQGDKPHGSARRNHHQAFFIPRGPSSEDWDSVMEGVQPIDPHTARVDEADAPGETDEETETAE